MKVKKIFYKLTGLMFVVGTAFLVVQDAHSVVDIALDIPRAVIDEGIQTAAEVAGAVLPDQGVIVETGICKCYCSDICGPRDVKPGDAPFYDPEYGFCFCAPRDKENYIMNLCHEQPSSPVEPSCCSVPPAE